MKLGVSTKIKMEQIDCKVESSKPVIFDTHAHVSASALAIVRPSREGLAKQFRPQRQIATQARGQGVGAGEDVRVVVRPGKIVRLQIGLTHGATGGRTQESKLARGEEVGS